MVVVQESIPAREHIRVTNPITGAEIGTIPVSDEAEVRAAVERARIAQRGWGAQTVKERRKIMRRWADLMWQQRDETIRMVRQETGKTASSAFEEIMILDLVLTYYYHQAGRILRPQKRRSAIPLVFKTRVYYKPYGVAGFITPWNYPALLAMLDAAAALFAGNAVIIKPSEVTPFTALHLVDLMRQAGMPENVVQVMTGDGHTGAALVDQVDTISFTGSTATGRKVAVQAAERLIPCSLELGGKDPLIVLQDADLNLAAAAAVRGAVSNTGQVCTAVERVYVEEAVHDAFVERVLYHAARLKMGADNSFDLHLGSMTNERELLRVEDHIRDAVGKGARVVCGGNRRPDLGPLFFEPTVLVGVDHSMTVMREETFGPLLPIMRVANAEEAIRLANDSVYGLSGAVYAGKLRRGEAIARQMDSGDVTVNRTHLAWGTPSVPMGGCKSSGIGRRNGPEGLLRFVTPQSIILDTQFLQQPSLSLADPLTVRVALIMRRLRRYLGFL